MKKLIIFFVCCALAAPLFSQQIPTFSLYKENSFFLNPGITGSQGHGIVAASYRQQWTKIENAPRTVNGGFQMPIFQKRDQFQRAGNFIGIGAYIMNDKTGPTSFTEGAVTFAYHISFAKINPFSWARFLRKSHLSIGLAASVLQYRLNSSEFKPDDANDLYLSSADASRVLPNAGVGVYYYYDKFFLGYSAPYLIPYSLKYEESDAVSTLKRANHHFIVLGGKIPFGGKARYSGKAPKGYESKFYLEPMVWFKYVKNAPYQYDIYARFRHKNIVWVGAGYRSSLTMVVDAGVMIKKVFSIGYAFDMPLSDLRPNLGSSHEIILAYHFNSSNRSYRR